MRDLSNHLFDRYLTNIINHNLKKVNYLRVRPLFFLIFPDEYGFRHNQDMIHILSNLLVLFSFYESKYFTFSNCCTHIQCREHTTKLSPFVFQS